ncbi:Solute carrier 2 (Facilitated glucose transporter) member 8 [Desmophyllum pertusum]|uniref:Solute carrier 2 (Facilitated glucose transporter) member 8 n=1 Tax=Desmophyllum pertusum TaxID=174260 RepID=A0A9X0D2V6_9CNID|nr:Solute carrier 2 (Facilitated glucose transporter) member 8 [Desmophyllum pertusum]
MVDAELDNEYTSRSVQSERMSGKDRVGRTILATFIAALGPLSFGYCLGYSSSALEDLENANASSSVHLTVDQGSWFASLVTVGAVFGSPVGGWAIDKLGRKSTIMFCVVPFELGWLLISYAQNRTMLYAGRVITGLACGTISLAVPVYIAEIVAARLRGMLGSVNQLAVTVGLLLAYVVGVLCHWRWLALIGAIPPALLLILMFSMPETPRWSLGKNRRSAALKSLLWLRGPDVDIEEECFTIEATLDRHERPQLRDVLSPVIAKPLIISLGLMVFQQFCGINAVLFNAAHIFAIAGFSNGKLVTIAVGLVQFVGTAIACLLMDRVGRRILLWTTALGMCVSLLGLGVYFEIYIPPKDAGSASDTVSLLGSISHSVPAKTISWLSILCIILFNLIFALAWGPVPWLVMSEIFPLRARGPASSFATMVNWTLAFVVTKTYDSMVTAFTIQGVYWFYAGCCLLGFIFVYLLMPETKGKTLEEIEALFDN